MTQKEKLIELIDQKQVYGIAQEQPSKRDLLLLDNDELADYLLANGVIVPPCKVGDMLYDVYGAVSNGFGNIQELKVPEIHINFDRRNRPWFIISGYCFAFDDFGKNVFLTREEAEKALAEITDKNLQE